MSRSLIDEVERQMKLKTFFNIVVIGIVAFALIVSGVFDVGTIAAQSISASLSPTAGLVQFRSRGSTQWTTVRQTQSIVAGDQIRTGSNGLGVLTTSNGIELTIYPSAIIQLSKFGTGSNGGQEFIIYQLAGSVFSNVQRKGSRDLVQVYLPPAGLTVRGTQFLTQVAPGIGGGVVGREGTVAMRTADGRAYTVAPYTLGYGRIDAETLASIGVTQANLKANTTSSFNTVSGLRSYLKDLLVMYHTPITREFLTELLEIPATSSNDEINAAIDTLAVTASLSGERLTGLSQTSRTIRQILTEYMDNFWLTTYKNSLNEPIAAASCGNLVQDDGETFESCPDDFVDLATCGNGLCEEETKGESTFSCSQDCFPFLDIGLQAMVQGEITDQESRRTPSPSTPRPSGVGSGG
jgi:hypothetical protein